MNSLPARWSVSCWIGPAEQFVGFQVDLVALEVERLDPDLPRPADLGVQAREAEAPLLVLDRRVPLDDLGVDEDLLLVLLLGVGRQVQDEEPVRQGDLIGGQADPLRGVHQVEHGPHRGAQVVVDPLDGARLIPKGGMGIRHDPGHENSPVRGVGRVRSSL